VDQFNIYLMSGNEEETLDIYGREIVPGFQSHSTPHRVGGSPAQP
jgi:hypothetical protein